jgi:addiction module HigA family antidote
MTIKNQYFPQTITPPGETLFEKLEEMGMGSKEFALRTGKPEKTITAVFNGKSAITADMAIQFEQVTKIPASYWLNHQRGYDEYLAREKRKQLIKESIGWAKHFPLKDMIALDWLPASPKMEEQTQHLLSFFAFAHHKAWEGFYIKQQLKVVFGLSLSQTNNPYAVSAWLRKGDIQAESLHVQKYSSKKFKQLLIDLTVSNFNLSEVSFNQLQNCCAEVGVKLIQTPSLSSLPIIASTRWLNNAPIIQVSENFNENQQFLKDFFHAAGHILLHGKKEIFLEHIELKIQDKEKEKEANEFALKYTQHQ